MNQLSDERILVAYFDAVNHNLSQDFIQILREEIQRRGLDVDIKEESRLVK